MVVCTLESPAMSTKLFGYFALSYYCWYSCRCLLTTSMVARVQFMVWYLSWVAFRKIQDRVIEEERV
jgi:hypothetical protein